ncbi:hypothetical protein BH10BDE1_BH10BDE1_21020 [soil metagenome]
MVDLNPVLRCLLVIEESLARGESVREGINAWLGGEMARAPYSFGEIYDRRAFRDEILDFMRRNESSEADSSRFVRVSSQVQSVYRQSLFLILESGIAGQAILPALKDLRSEIEAQLELDMKAHVESLPLKTLIPLLLCMFPAFLILLLGPITRNFLEVLK